jgi:hypothetical protein
MALDVMASLDKQLLGANDTYKIDNALFRNMLLRYEALTISWCVFISLYCLLRS